MAQDVQRRTWLRNSVVLAGSATGLVTGPRLLGQEYLFPRFRKANKLVDLVDVLLQQHQAGRVLTDRAMQLASVTEVKDAGKRSNLRNLLYQFVRMYEPHEAREDTVLFRRFAGSSRSMSTRLSAKSSRRKKTRSFEATVSRKTWKLSPN